MSNDHKEINTGNGPRKFFSSGTSAKTVPFDSIPIIDFSAMFEEDETAKMNVGAAVREACTEVGFFYIKNHFADPLRQVLTVYCSLISLSFFIFNSLVVLLIILISLILFFINSSSKYKL